MKKAFITGVNGQDGSYLSEFLLSKGYEIHAILRRSSVFTTARIDHLMNNPRFHTYHGDLTDSSNLHTLLATIVPDEVYNLGAQSHVAVSFEVPEYTAEVDAIGTIRLLDAIKDLGISTKFYQASTSELFGGLPETAPQDEETPFHPRSPYGAAKLYAHWVTTNYREAYGLFACNGILFNHESPRRGETFVTRKITRAATRIRLGLQSELYLGTLDSKRDWGYAREFVEAMWLMLQQQDPDDFVVATGRNYSVQQFVETAFEAVDLDWRQYVKFDPRYVRPTEVSTLLGDPSKARDLLGWKATVHMPELCNMMINADMELAEKERTLVDAGHSVCTGN